MFTRLFAAGWFIIAEGGKHTSICQAECEINYGLMAHPPNKELHSCLENQRIGKVLGTHTGRRQDTQFAGKCMCVYVKIHVWKPEAKLRCHSSTGVVFRDGGLSVGVAGQQAPETCLVLDSPAEISKACHHSCMLLGFWELNSGSQACKRAPGNWAISRLLSIFVWIMWIYHLLKHYFLSLILCFQLLSWLTK